MERGNVVLATAGKEKNQIFVVLKLKKNNPKKKNFKHLKMFTNSKMDAQILDDDNERVNCAIRKFLKQIRSEHV